MRDSGLQAWRQYFDDLRAFARSPQTMEVQGTLVKVAGLVLEAAGVRVPVGSVCEVRMEGQPPVQAEVCLLYTSPSPRDD